MLQNPSGQKCVKYLTLALTPLPLIPLRDHDHRANWHLLLKQLLLLPTVGVISLANAVTTPAIATIAAIAAIAAAPPSPRLLLGSALFLFQLQLLLLLLHQRLALLLLGPLPLPFQRRLGWGVGVGGEGLGRGSTVYAVKARTHSRAHSTNHACMHACARKDCTDSAKTPNSPAASGL